MFEFIPVILKNALHRPATRNYPKVVRAPFAGDKGHIENDIANCIFCGMCSRKCPAGAITVTRAEKTWAINRFQCITCNACVECCPKKCLSMAVERAPVARRKSADVYRLPAGEQPPRPAVPVPKKVPAATPVGAGQTGSGADGRA